MYASVHDHHVTYSWLFRECGRLGGVVVIVGCCVTAIVELGRFGLPAPDAYLQGGALAIVFTGYIVGWRKETVGAALVILGTAVFYLAHVVTFAGTPMPAIALLAAPGIFFLLTRYVEHDRDGEVAKSHEH